LTVWLSLCIVQDSPSDWATEASKMAHVYGYADCTIAYLLHPQDVLTKPRQDPRIWSRCIFRRTSSTLRGVYIHPIIPPSDMDWLSPKDWPLFTRAWTCQEYLLSPRIVFAGHRNLIWECSELLSDELLGPMDELTGATASKTHFSAVRSVTLPVTTMSEQLEFVQNWRMLVRHYRAGVLTQPKDRIMAFAGIAQAVHNSSGMIYLAGSWAQMFPYSFIWNVEFPSLRSENAEVEAVIEAVPSWSWFSVPISSPDVLTFAIVDRLQNIRRLWYDEAIAPMYQATLLPSEDMSQHAYADASPTKAFHSFTGMTLNLAMKTWTGSLENSMDPELRCARSIKNQFKMLFKRRYGQLECLFDHQNMVHNQFDREMTFGLLIEFRTGRGPEWYGLSVPFLIGLIMQPEPNREAYKRIGIWALYLDGLPMGWDEEKFNSVSIFDQLEGVRSEHIRLA
jgi:hypothetical protein